VLTGSASGSSRIVSTTERRMLSRSFRVCRCTFSNGETMMSPTLLVQFTCHPRESEESVTAAVRAAVAGECDDGIAALPPLTIRPGRCVRIIAVVEIRNSIWNGRPSRGGGRSTSRSLEQGSCLAVFVQLGMANHSSRLA